MNMYHLVSQTLAYQVEGDLVEVCCNTGQSAVLIAKVMREFASTRELQLYDSFAGLPLTKAEDGMVYKEGESRRLRRHRAQQLSAARPEGSDNT